MKYDEFDVHAIISAYESGVGQAGRGLVNPFKEDTPEFQAYAEGIEKGLEIIKEKS